MDMNATQEGASSLGSDANVFETVDGFTELYYRGANKFRCSVYAWHPPDIDLIPDFCTDSSSLPQPHSIDSPYVHTESPRDPVVPWDSRCFGLSQVCTTITASSDFACGG